MLRVLRVLFLSLFLFFSSFFLAPSPSFPLIFSPLLFSTLLFSPLLSSPLSVSLLSFSLSLFSSIFKPEQILIGLFGGTPGQVKEVKGTDLYIICVASAQELPDVEALHLMNPDVPIVFFNLKLDTLRGDLGVPAFPSKDLHDRFLSRVRPIYYLKTRQYSRSKLEPPFVVNYQGESMSMSMFSQCQCSFLLQHVWLHVWLHVWQPSRAPFPFSPELAIKKKT